MKKKTTKKVVKKQAKKAPKAPDGFNGFVMKPATRAQGIIRIKFKGNRAYYEMNGVTREQVLLAANSLIKSVGTMQA